MPNFTSRQGIPAVLELAPMGGYSNCLTETSVLGDILLLIFVRGLAVP